jgi:hypothetical protein
LLKCTLLKLAIRSIVDELIKIDQDFFLLQWQLSHCLLGVVSVFWSSTSGASKKTFADASGKRINLYICGKNDCVAFNLIYKITSYKRLKIPFAVEPQVQQPPLPRNPSCLSIHARHITRLANVG